MMTDPDTGAIFVATMEGKDLPFYGTQFHPEKVITMYNHDDLDHEWTSLNYNRYFADRFLEMARMNTNSCGTFAECQELIIDNYAVTVTEGTYGNIYAF